MGYSREVYEQAEAELEKRRIRSEQELEKRRQSLFSRSPRAQEIERQIAHTSIAAARSVLGGADVREQLMGLKEHNLRLQQELDDILKSMKLPANYLEPWFFCDACRDRGDIDGKMCQCMKTLLRQISYDRLNQISPLSLSDFDSFSTEYYSKQSSIAGKPSPFTHMTGVLGFCKKYARSFSESSRSLLFQGAPGLGKTHLSLAIARDVIERGYGVIYVSAPAILTKLSKETFSFDTPSGSSAEQLLTECDLLILDDLGTEFTSKITVSLLYNIINSRMILSKPTIISTNLTLAELQEKYNSRIISRIIGTLDRVEFIGTDIRQLKRRQRTQQSQNTKKDRSV